MEVEEESERENNESVPLNEPCSGKNSPVGVAVATVAEKTEETVELPLGPTEQQKIRWRRYAGLAFALLASLFFSATALLVKLLQQNYHHHSFVLTMWRYGGILIPAIPITIYFQRYKKVKVFETLCPIHKEGHWKNLMIYLIQGILGCTSIICRFVSFQYIPIADSTVVFSASTVVTTLFAHFCLGEKCSTFSVLLAVITGIGVIIIARPPIINGKSELNLEFLTGTVYALLALLCASTFIIVMRKIRKTHFTLMMLVGGIWGVFESGAFALLFGVFTFPRNTTDLVLTVALACFTFLGQVCFIFGIKYESAGPFTIARTTESIYAFIWQIIFLGITPDYISILGGSLVITAVFGTGYCKYLASLPTNDFLRRKLNFMLK